MKDSQITHLARSLNVQFLQLVEKEEATFDDTIERIVIFLRQEHPRKFNAEDFINQVKAMPF
jgi:hypothetical protein